MSGEQSSGQSPDRARRLSLKWLLRNRTLRVLTVRGLGVAALFGLEISMARWLGVAGYGAFNFLLAIAVVVARVAPLGWLHASTRLISAFDNSKQYGLLKGALIQAHVTTVVGFALAVLLVWLAGLAWPTSLSTVNLWYLAPLIAGLALVELHRYLLRGFHAGDLGEALPVLILPSIVMLVGWLFRVRYPDTAVYLYSASCAAVVVISTIAIFRRIQPAVRQSAAAFRAREWTLVALAMLVGGLSDEITSHVAVLVLGFLGDERGVGLFQAAFRLALMNVFMLRILSPVAAPKISVLFSEGRQVELRAEFKRLCLLSLAGAVPFFLVFWFAAGFVLSSFGPEFADAAPILRILSVGYLASAATGPCATALLMIGKERLYGVLAFINMLLNAALGFYLARNYGATGVAVSTAALMVLANVTYVVIFLRSTRSMSPV